MIQITEPKEKDIFGIQQVFYKTWIETYINENAGITKEDIEDRFKDSFTKEGQRKRWERIKNSSNSKTFIAKDGDLVVGVIIVECYQDHNQLKAIYVLSENQGMGIGRQLWQKAQQYPAKKWRVQCATYNINAQNFYKKLGFKDTGKRWNDEKRKMKSGAMIPEMEMEKLN